ncbi:hypothetical protein ACLOJK_028339 [Asimina triloba]
MNKDSEVEMSDLKLLMSPSRIHKGQKQPYYFRSIVDILGFCNRVLKMSTFVWQNVGSWINMNFDLQHCIVGTLEEMIIPYWGATIVDLSVSIAPALDYQLPPAASAPLAPNETKPVSAAESAVQKAEDVVTSMLAKGFILGKDAVNKAKAFDEKHQFSSTATAKVASFDKKIGLTEKLSTGASAVNDKVREMDQRFQVSEKTKSAFTAAEQKVSSAGSAILKNQYVFTSAAWVTGAYNRVTKAASDMGSKTKERVVTAQEEQKQGTVEEFAQVRLSESPPKSSVPTKEPSKPLAAQGLIL